MKYAVTGRKDRARELLFFQGRNQTGFWMTAL